MVGNRTEEKNKAEEIEVDEIKVLTCPMCNKEIDPKDWNAYYHACNACVNSAGRIGS